MNQFELDSTLYGITLCCDFIATTASLLDQVSTSFVHGENKYFFAIFFEILNTELPQILNYTTISKVLDFQC